MMRRICRRFVVAVANRTVRRAKRCLYKEKLCTIRARASLLSRDLAAGFDGHVFDGRSESVAGFGDEVLQAAERIVEGYFVLFGAWVKLPADATGVDEWYVDFSSGYRFKDGAYDAVKPETGVADIKVPWEYGRMQYLLPLAAAFRLTGETRFLDTYRLKIMGFSTFNPLGCGVQWACTMEVGIRAFNMLASYELLRKGIDIDDPLHERVAELSICHGKHIWANLETSAKLQENNHYIADLLGLAAIVAAYPRLPDGPRWGKYTHSELVRCSRKQVLDDGCCFERSVRYTRLVGEMLFFAGKCLAYTPYALPSEYFERLAVLGGFLDAMTSADGSSLQVGDNDSGRVVCISPARYDDLRLVGRLVEREANRGCSSGVFFAEEGLFYGGMERTPVIPSWDNGVRLFPEAGMALVRSRGWSLGFYAVDGFRGGAEPGHTHNDKLSLTLDFKGKRFFVDPGSGSYTRDPGARNALRGTSQHTTLRFGDMEQNEFGALFGYARCGGSGLEVEEREAAIVLRGETDCWRGRLGVIHRRCVEVESDGVTILDELDGPAPKMLAMRAFVLSPAVKVDVIGRQTALLESGGVSILFQTDGNIDVREGLYSPRYGVVERTQILDVSFEYGKTNVATIKECFDKHWN